VSFPPQASDIFDGYKMIDIIKDIESLLDRLKIKRVFMMGISAGTPAALISPKILGERVRGIGLIGAILPDQHWNEALEIYNDKLPIDPMSIFTQKLCVYAPLLFKMMSLTLTPKTINDSKKSLESIFSDEL
jgi:pimeloyl-ACP methyl ester carboxylesterase